jgi:hypothetical protein
MQMPLARYLQDTNIAYLSMQIAAVGVGYILQRAHNNFLKA